MTRTSETLRNLAETHGAYLLAMAFQMTRDRSAAQDLVQDSLLALLHADRQRGIEMTNPMAYLLTTMTRRHLRVRGSTSPLVLPDKQIEEIYERLGSHHPNHAEAIIARDHVWSALEQLTDNQRTVLVLRYLVDLSDAQIAGILSAPESTVRSHAARGLAAVRKVIEATERSEHRQPAVAVQLVEETP